MMTTKFNIPEFWDILVYGNTDKIVITTREYNDAIELVSILRNQEILNWIDKESIYQKKFSMDYKGFKLRGILDLITN
jgi:hypothetical protein